MKRRLIKTALPLLGSITGLVAALLLIAAFRGESVARASSSAPALERAEQIQSTAQVTDTQVADTEEMTETGPLTETMGSVESTAVTDVIRLAEDTVMTDTMNITDTTGTDADSTGTDSSDTDSTGTVADTTMPAQGTGPENALTPTGERVALPPNTVRWYTFKYDWDGESDPAEVIAELRMDEPGTISYEVWSQDDLRRWQNGEDFTPTGAGTAAVIFGDEDRDRDRSLLRWVGSSAATVTYYLLVENTSDDVAYYTLSVVGDTVSFPGVTMSESMTGTMGMTDTAGMTGTVDGMELAAPTGSGPDDAMIPMGGQETIPADSTRWYSFLYSWDGESDPSEVVVELRMAEPNALSFEVWSQDDVADWQAGDEFTPTGAGTPAFAIRGEGVTRNRDRTLLRWVGSSAATVTYYVIVENNTDAPADYRLTVTGPTVSFPGSLLTAPPEATTPTVTPGTAVTPTTEITGTTGITDTMEMTGTTPLTETMGSTESTALSDTLRLADDALITETVEITDTDEITESESTP